MADTIFVGNPQTVLKAIKAGNVFMAVAPKDLPKKGESQGYHLDIEIDKNIAIAAPPSTSIKKIAAKARELGLSDATHTIYQVGTDYEYSIDGNLKREGGKLLIKGGTIGHSIEPEKDKCTLCGSVIDTDSDHIRTAYLNRDGTLHPSYYQPRINIEEKYLIKSANGSGEFKICSNRTNCRKRMKANSMSEGGGTGHLIMAQGGSFTNYIYPIKGRLSTDALKLLEAEHKSGNLPNALKLIEYAERIRDYEKAETIKTEHVMEAIQYLIHQNRDLPIFTGEDVKVILGLTEPKQFSATKRLDLKMLDEADAAQVRKAQSAFTDLMMKKGDEVLRAMQEYYGSVLEERDADYMMRQIIARTKDVTQHRVTGRNVISSFPYMDFQFYFMFPHVKDFIEARVVKCLANHGASNFAPAEEALNWIYFTYGGKRFMLSDNDVEFKLDCPDNGESVGGVDYGDLETTCEKVCKLADDYLNGKVEGTPAATVQEGEHLTQGIKELMLEALNQLGSDGEERFSSREQMINDAVHYVDAFRSYPSYITDNLKIVAVYESPLGGTNEFTLVKPTKEKAKQYAGLVWDKVYAPRQKETSSEFYARTGFWRADDPKSVEYFNSGVKLEVKKHPEKKGYTIFHNQPIGWSGTTKKYFGWYKEQSDAQQRADELMTSARVGKVYPDSTRDASGKVQLASVSYLAEGGEAHGEPKTEYENLGFDAYNKFRIREEEDKKEYQRYANQSNYQIDLDRATYSEGGGLANYYESGEIKVTREGKEFTLSFEDYNEDRYTHPDRNKKGAYYITLGDDSADGVVVESRNGNDEIEPNEQEPHDAVQLKGFNDDFDAMSEFVIEQFYKWFHDKAGRKSRKLVGEGGTLPTTYAGKKKMYYHDIHGNVVHFGDKLKVQYVSGSYGQTRTIIGRLHEIDQFGGFSMDVEGSIYRDKYTPLPTPNRERILPQLEWDATKPTTEEEMHFVGRVTHNDYEHGHTRFVEIIEPAKLGEGGSCGCGTMEEGGEMGKGGEMEEWRLPAILKDFMPYDQLRVIRGNKEIRKDLDRLGKEVEAIPPFYSGEKLNEELKKKFPESKSKDRVIVYAHFFSGGTDVFVSEWDRKDSLIYGYTILNGDHQMSEAGYSNLEELRRNLELDFYWKVTTLSDALHDAAPKYFAEPKFKEQILAEVGLGNAKPQERSTTTDRSDKIQVRSIGLRISGGEKATFKNFADANAWMREKLDNNKGKQSFSNMEYTIAYHDGHVHEGVIDCEPESFWRGEREPLTFHLKTFWSNLANQPIEKLKPLYSEEDKNRAQEYVNNYDLGGTANDQKGLTPFMRQYYKIKERYPNDLALFKVGEFYEAYGQDAVKLAKTLGIVLTKRSKVTDRASTTVSDGTDIELSGFPVHAFSTYLQKLHEKGISVLEVEIKPAAEPKVKELKATTKDTQMQTIAAPKKEITGKDFKGTSYPYSNAFTLNKAIEEFVTVIKKGSKDHKDYTTAEKGFISQYSGMGGLIKEGATGKGILYEFFTPDDICKKMWALAYKFGFAAGGNVAETACGTGALLKYLPRDTGAIYTAYDINAVSATIAKVLYPHVDVINDSFETMFIKNKDTVRKNVDKKHIIYDLVITNPPYGEFTGRYAGMGEKEYTKASTWVEYYFFRGLDILKPGGLLVYIVGTEVAVGGVPFLAKGTNNCKKAIAEKAELVAAYRLPNGVFDRSDVLTDIIVLRKK